MHIDTHELPTVVVFAHRGLLHRMDVNTPMITRGVHEERRPRSFMASLEWAGYPANDS
jgi:hypothetical protein